MIILMCCFISSCDSGLGQSDMKGVFETDHGECVKEGDVGLTIHKGNVHIDFYCFLDKCADMDTAINKGGHFYVSDSKGHYIQGQILANKSKGSWYLTMKQQKCSGTWFAVRQ